MIESGGRRFRGPILATLLAGCATAPQENFAPQAERPSLVAAGAQMGKEFLQRTRVCPAEFVAGFDVPEGESDAALHPFNGLYSDPNLTEDERRRLALGIGYGCRTGDIEARKTGGY